MQLKITLEDNKNILIDPHTKLLDLVKKVAPTKEKSILAAFVDNKMRELSSFLDKDASVRLVGIQSLDGLRIYQRSAVFIMLKALTELHPQAQANILHPLANGLYIEIEGGVEIGAELIKNLQNRMRALVDRDIPFHREEMAIGDAIELFKKLGKEDKARLLSYRNTSRASIYKLEDETNYFYGYLAPSTGYIQNFEITAYDKGIILHLPSLTHPTKLTRAKKSKKLFEVFKETRRWRQILKVEDVGSLNEVIQSERYTEFVIIAEAFHEKKIAQLADMVKKKGGIRVVLISGASASGKTTFTKRLAVQLTINGFKPIHISMDDYFLDRDKTPKQPSGEHDFESPYAINVNLFRQNMADIIEGKETQIPHYDFKTGTSHLDGTIIKPDENGIILIEGIHGMNPMFYADLPRENIFKIYVSPLTEVPLDHHNRIPTTDTRILRRIIRDHQFRNYGAAQTILRWPSVREGESRYVFPFQEEADVFFNTALIYELAALKTRVEPVLLEVPQDSPAYAEAVRLLKFLSYFQPIPFDVVPRHSILREFLGGSSFKY